MASKRRIFIGDVQGCSRELERLLTRVRFEPGKDELHPVGDFVNRGPDSLGVLRLMFAIRAGGVLGNHDLHLLRVASGSESLRDGDTLRPILEAPDRPVLLDWLRRKPFVRTWKDVVLVHAGLHPKWRDPKKELAGRSPLRRSEAVEFVTHVRYCTKSGRRPERGDRDPGPPFRPWFDFYPAPQQRKRIVVFGHWAARGLVHRPLLRGLDTGCLWGGRLTAWIAEEDSLVSVPAAHVYRKP